MFSTMTITSDPQLWQTAAFILGGMFGIILFAFALMHAAVRPDRR